MAKVTMTVREMVSQCVISSKDMWLCSSITASTVASKALKDRSSVDGPPRQMSRTSSSSISGSSISGSS